MAGRGLRRPEAAGRPARPDQPGRGRSGWRTQIARVIAENELEFFRLDYNVGGLGAGRADRARRLRGERLLALLRGPLRHLRPAARALPRCDLRELRRRRRAHRHRHGAPLQPHLGHRLADRAALLHHHQRHDHGAAAGVRGPADRRAERAHHRRVRFPVRGCCSLCGPRLAFFHPLGAQWNPSHAGAAASTGSTCTRASCGPSWPPGASTTTRPTSTGPSRRAGACWSWPRATARGHLRACSSSPRRTQPEYLLRLRGLDVARRYRVTWDNTGQTCEVDGFTLMKQGLTVRLEGALTSELLLMQAV